MRASRREEEEKEEPEKRDTAGSAAIESRPPPLPPPPSEEERKISFRRGTAKQIARQEFGGAKAKAKPKPREEEDDPEKRRKMLHESKPHRNMLTKEPLKTLMEWLRRSQIEDKDLHKAIMNIGEEELLEVKLTRSKNQTSTEDMQLFWHGTDTLARRFMTRHGTRNCNTEMPGTARHVISWHVACTVPASL